MDVSSALIPPPGDWRCDRKEVPAWDRFLPPLGADRTEGRWGSGWAWGIGGCRVGADEAGVEAGDVVAVVRRGGLGDCGGTAG